MSPIWAIAPPEFLCIGFLFLLYRWHPLSAWAIGFLILLHYCFWLPILWRDANAITPLYEVYSPRVFLLIYVAYGAACLLYLKSSPQIATPMERSDSSSKWVLVSSALALAALPPARNGSATLLHATADESSLVAGKRHRRLASRSLENSSRCQVRGFGNTSSRFLKTVLHVPLTMNHMIVAIFYPVVALMIFLLPLGSSPINKSEASLGWGSYAFLVGFLAIGLALAIRPNHTMSWLIPSAKWGDSDLESRARVIRASGILIIIFSIFCIFLSIRR